MKRLVQQLNNMLKNIQYDRIGLLFRYAETD